MKSRVLALDPSVNNVGYCTCELSEIKEDDCFATIAKNFKWGVWHLQGMNYLTKCADLVDRMFEEGADEIDYLIIEWPTFFNSDAGQIAAHNNYTIDLAGICMYVVGRLGLHPNQVVLYTAIQWKGTVPKRVTARKFFKRFKLDASKISEHAIDATMMLNHWLDRQTIQVSL